MGGGVMVTPEDIRPSTPPDVPAVIVPPARDVADGEAFAAWLDTAAARARARAAASAQVLPLPRVERAPEARPRMIDEDDDEDSLAPWMRHPVGGAALGAGESVDGALVWAGEPAEGA